MKKNIALLLVVFMLLSLCLTACNDADVDSESPMTEPSDALNSDTHSDEETLEQKKYSVKYTEAEGGRIKGVLEQTVVHGNKAKTVEAIAYEGYVFVAWSDGLTTAKRVDGPITSDLEIYPIFERDPNYFMVTYVVMRGNVTVINEVKFAKLNQNVSCTVPEPEFAYEFAGWSDGSAEMTRVDTADSDGMTYYGEYKPICLDTPVISINTKDGSGVTSKVNYNDCTVTLENADDSYCFENVEAQIRGRGNSSWDRPKKSYRIKFTKKRSIMGSEYEAKSWTLIANYGDKSLSRNALAYEMSQRFEGLDFSSTNEFVELYLNGEYMGVYLLCDQIQVGEGRVDIGETFADDPSAMGFLIELDARSNEEGKLGYDYDVLDYDRQYLIKSPDSSDPAYDPQIHLKYVRDYLNSCLDALGAQEWDKICELMDIDSFVDMYILNEMFANLDHYKYSCYFYKVPNGKLFAGPAWDFDISSGNVNYGYAEGSYDSGPRQDLIYSGTLWIADNHTWYRRLLRNEEFVSLLQQRLAEYREIIFEVAALADSEAPDGYYARYGQAVERNFVRWQILDVGIWTEPQALVDIKTAAGQMDYLSSWLIERYGVLCEVYGVSAVS